MHWKFYFWFNVVLVVLGVVVVWINIFSIVLVSLIKLLIPLSILSALPPDSTMTPSLLSNPILLLYPLLGVVTLIGLYSFIYGKKLFSEQFWKIFFFVNIVIIVAGLVQTQMKTFPGKGNVAFGSLLLIQIITILYRVPMLYALYQIGNNHFLQSEKKNS